MQYNILIHEKICKRSISFNIIFILLELDTLHLLFLRNWKVFWWNALHINIQQQQHRFPTWSKDEHVTGIYVKLNPFSIVKPFKFCKPIFVLENKGYGIGGLKSYLLSIWLLSKMHALNVILLYIHNMILRAHKQVSNIFFKDQNNVTLLDYICSICTWTWSVEIAFVDYTARNW